MNDGSKIVMTRYNHFTGLMIHELLHFFKLDQKGCVVDNNWDTLFKKYIQIDNQGYFFEGINNFKACILNILIKKFYYSKKNGNSFSLDDYSLKTLFKLEYKMSEYLCLKTLKFLNCRDLQDLKNVKTYFEGSFYEYIFIKHMLLNHIYLFANNDCLTLICSVSQMEIILQKFNMIYNAIVYNNLKKILRIENLEDMDQVDFYEL